MRRVRDHRSPRKLFSKYVARDLSWHERLTALKLQGFILHFTKVRIFGIRGFLKSSDREMKLSNCCFRQKMLSIIMCLSLDV